MGALRDYWISLSKKEKSIEESIGYLRCLDFTKLQNGPITLMKRTGRLS